MIKLSTLEDIVDNPSKSSRVRRVAGALAQAINDWPTSDLASLEGYITELRAEIGELSEQNIRAKLDNYSVAGDAWKMESLTGLLGAWDTLHTNILLDDLVAQLHED